MAFLRLACCSRAFDDLRPAQPSPAKPPPEQVETLSGERLREIVAEYTEIPEKLAAV